jgi:hypothetical protein
MRKEVFFISAIIAEDYRDVKWEVGLIFLCFRAEIGMVFFKIFLSKKMNWDVTEVRIIDDYVLQVRFQDGIEGAVKFLPSFFRGVFLHLQDKMQFQKVMIVDGVVTWPGELDIAPDAMHHAIAIYGEWDLD